MAVLLNEVSVRFFIFVLEWIVDSYKARLETYL